MRTTFYLTPHPDGGWLGKQDESENYLIVSNFKQEVLEYLVNLCDFNRPCSIFIHDDKGKLIKEKIYGSRHNLEEL